MGIYWNLHISVEEIYKFVFLHVKYFNFSFRETFLESFLSPLRGLDYSFKSKCGEKGSFLHMSKGKGNAKSLVCCIVISN